MNTSNNIKGHSRYAMGYFRNAVVCNLEIPKEATMLIRFSCRDMGLSCPFVVKGATLEEVTQKAFEHVREKHSKEFNIIESPAQIEAMQKALARSTRVVPG
jgi:predicted small metal-binding protein